jgi:UDP-glucose 4-epimerase
VTGAARYVGSVCLEQLIARGHNLIPLNNLSQGQRQAVPKKAVFIGLDLGDAKVLDRIFREDRADAAMHFAAESLVEKSVCEPSGFFKANVAYGIYLLDAMMRHRVWKFIFSSTAAVYGGSEVTLSVWSDSAAKSSTLGTARAVLSRKCWRPRAPSPGSPSPLETVRAAQETRQSCWPVRRRFVAI